MLPERYRQFHKELLEFIPADNIYTDPLRTLAYGTDASFYRLIPKIVVDTNVEDEVVGILKLASSHKLPVTFRAAGTSLSGQAVSDSVLIRLGDGWRKFKIFDEASKVQLQPGIIGSHANRLLAEFGKKIGPDPASIDSAKIGGIVANNASGMCCGVAENSYKTLHSMRVVMYDGTTLDTSDDKSRAEFARRHPNVLERLRLLRQKVMADNSLAELITRKFKIKNTTGYSLNALVDFEDPFDILQHLMIGSEGTLGFISEVTYRTVIEHRHKASALMLFPDIKSACEATIVLKQQPVAAVELIDRAGLRSVQDKPGMPGGLTDLGEEAAALLVETRSNEKDTLNRQIAEILASIEHIPCVHPHVFTDVPEEFGKLWAVRKGLFPAVGAVRRIGTTVIIEDVAFPIESLAQATLELQGLFKKHGYDEAIIFGHALEGNLHFVFTQDFGDRAEVSRYQAFMDDVCAMVAGAYKGSLKAEHGTGRNMAPFVEMEWGRDAYMLMKEIKNIFDPHGLLNPGVIINEDAEAHIKNLKPLPAAHSIVDKCIECGFCEPICPSRDVTFTPRQRIVSWREVCRMENEEEKNKLLKTLLKGYNYLGEDTCAADGLCATRCPVGINTGSFIKHLRSTKVGPRAHKAATWVGDHFGTVAKTVATGLKGVSLAHRLFGTTFMDGASRTLRVVSLKKIPMWNKEMPGGLSPVKPVPVNQATPLKAVYFPSCVSRTMGPAKNDRDRDPLPAKTVSLLAKAGYEVIFPEGMENLCCGQAFESKGYMAQADAKSKELGDALLKASGNGELPVLCDTSPCLYRMKETLDKRLTLWEPIDFVLEHLTDKLEFTRLPRRVAIHSTCTARKMGLDAKFKKLAELCAEEVVVPEDVFCCGFAGDRGFSFPELNASALKELRPQVERCDDGYSTSRTCEIGLSLHGGLSYRSILYLVDEATKPLPRG
jgi:D-lactate dehydrogenase